MNKQLKNYSSTSLIETEAELEQVMTQPSAEVISAVSEMEGDLMILGVGGKMGPTLARLAKRAIDEAGVRKRVIGVSRFSNPKFVKDLNDSGIETLSCDLLNQAELEALPEIPNLIYMAGMKFGATGNEALTWAMNVYLPGMIAQKFRQSKIVLFSTGNVYPLTPVTHGGCTESDATAPIGEYAQSCLGRERIFEYFCRHHKIPGVIIRLNYAIDLRYGVLLDVAQKVNAGAPIDLTMGHCNVIWQGEANAVVLRSFALCATPPALLNLTGPETVSIRWLAKRFGELFGNEPVFVGQEADTALLSNAGKCHALFGYPKVSLEQMVQWVAHWVVIGGPTLDKPTHFEERAGKF
jgi:nucleoside-diphosphate-sugar epimerase